MSKKITRTITGSGRRAAQTAVKTSTRAASRIPGMKSGYARAAAALSAETEVKPRRQVSEILLKYSAGGTGELIRRASAGGYLTAQMLEQAAHVERRTGDQDAVVAHLRAAYELEPTGARAAALALALTTIEDKGAAYDQVLGLTLAAVPAQLDEVFALLNKAEELAPGDPEVLRAVGIVTAQYGDPQIAVGYLRSAVHQEPAGEWLAELAELCTRPEVADYEQAFLSYERAYSQDPENAGHLTGLVAAGLHTGVDRARIWRTVRRMELSRKSSPYGDKHVQELVDKLMAGSAGAKGVEVVLKRLRELGAQGRFLHPSSQQLVAAQLLHMGYMREGYAVRRELAEARIERLMKSSTTRFERLRPILQALAYTGDYEQAAQLSDPRFWTGKDAFTRQKVEKLHAEVQLLRGDQAPYLDYARSARKKLPLEADEKLSALVGGKRVAILPATHVDAAGEYPLEAYDVIVIAGLRPEQTHADQGAFSGRRVIAYSGQFLRQDELEPLAAAVGEGQFELAVVPARTTLSEHSETIRPLRHTFSLALFGELSETEQAVYDLLQFQPKSLSVLQAGPDPRHEDAAEHIRDAVRHHDTLFDLRFLKTLHDQGILKAGSRQARRILRGSPDQHLKSLSLDLSGSGDRDGAEVDSPEAQRRLEKARLLLKSRRRGVVTDPVLGLTTGYVRRHEDEALAELDAALEISPGDPVLFHEKGMLLFEKGDVDEGLAHLEAAVAKNPFYPWFRELASAYRRPHVAQFEKALSAYERAFRKDPKDRRSLSGIVNIGVRGTLDWPRIWQSARQLELKDEISPYQDEEFGLLLDRIFRPDVTAEEVEEMLQHLDALEVRDRSLHPDVLGFLATRLQFMGHLGAGYTLRAKLARLKTSNAATDFEGLRQLMKALIYLDDYDRAALLSELRFWPETDPATLRKHEKIHAEAHLMRGNAAPYIEYSQKVREENPLPVDDLMEKLVRGKRVAIVGPVDTGDQLGSVIDDYDVIVRPRFNPEFVAQHTESMGSRTDIVYINGQDLEDDIPRMAQAVEDGTLQMAVARPLSYHLHHERELPWLRFYRQDFGLHFHGFALGLQRFAYDILQFAPAEIGIFNTDMYTGTDAFASGYRDAKDIGFKPGSIMNDLIVNHDLLFDFKYMRSLEATGILTLHGKAEEVGQMDPQDYVKAMEAGGALR